MKTCFTWTTVLMWFVVLINLYILVYPSITVMQDTGKVFSTIIYVNDTNPNHISVLNCSCYLSANLYSDTNISVISRYVSIGEPIQFYFSCDKQRNGWYLMHLKWLSKGNIATSRKPPRSLKKKRIGVFTTNALYCRYTSVYAAVYWMHYTKTCTLTVQYIQYTHYAIQCVTVPFSLLFWLPAIIFQSHTLKMTEEFRWNGSALDYDMHCVPCTLNTN